MRNTHDTAMRTVKCDKAQLVTKLGENKEKHEREFKEAMAGYWDAFANQLKRMQEQVKLKDLNVTHNINLKRPVDHSEEYTRAIEVLKWEQDTIVVLSMNDFQCYVMDDWDWRGEFEGVKALYSGR